MFMRIAMALLVLIILLYFYMIMPGLSRNRRMKEFCDVMFAHRGLYDNNGRAPENSMAAFRAAVEKGYGIELDVQLTKDHVPVVFHDERPSRILRDRDNMKVPKRIRDYTYAQLQEFHLLSSDQRVPSLADVLTAVHGRVPLIIEIKIDGNASVRSTCRTAQLYLDAYAGSYVMESFDPRAVLWYRWHRPHILRGQLAERFGPVPAITHKAVLWICRNLLFNHMTKPDFIAYSVRHPRMLSRRLCRNLYHNTAVGWTVRSEAELKAARKEFDGFIFESFEPAGGPQAGSTCHEM